MQDTATSLRQILIFTHLDMITQISRRHVKLTGKKHGIRESLGELSFLLQRRRDFPERTHLIMIYML